jgi:hypothetical protein
VDYYGTLSRMTKHNSPAKTLSLGLLQLRLGHLFIHSFIHSFISSSSSSFSSVTIISMSQLSRHEGRSETPPALRETGKSVRVSLEEALSVARTLLYPLDLPQSYQPDVKPEQIDALRKEYGRLAKCEAQLSAFEDVVGEGEEDAMPSDAVPSDAIRWFDHVVKQITTQRNGLVGDDAQDIQLVQTSSDAKCPITRKEFADGYFCIDCGHCYSKEGLESLLSGSHLTSCPVSGCSGKVSKKNILPLHR